MLSLIAKGRACLTHALILSPAHKTPSRPSAFESLKDKESGRILPAAPGRSSPTTAWVGELRARIHSPLITRARFDTGSAAASAGSAGAAPAVVPHGRVALEVFRLVACIVFEVFMVLLGRNRCPFSLSSVV